jgi:hypothetical protein
MLATRCPPGRLARRARLTTAMRAGTASRAAAAADREPWGTRKGAPSGALSSDGPKKEAPRRREALPLEQSQEERDHRSQRRMNKASDAETVRSTARLTGFENKKDTHLGGFLIPCARVPCGSQHRALGQRFGDKIKEPVPNCSGSFRCDAETSRRTVYADRLWRFQGHHAPNFS